MEIAKHTRLQADLNTRYPVMDRVPLRERQALGLVNHQGFPFPSLNCGASGVAALWTGKIRQPKRGEWYLSGCPIDAYRAPNDLNTKFHIAHLVGETKMKIARNDIAPRFRWISRKHNWSVTITEKGTDNFGTWWEGGSCRVLSYVNVETGKIGAASSIPTAGPFGGGEVMDIPMIEGEMILDCGTFCGREADPILHIHPNDLGFVVGRELVVDKK